MTDRNFRTSLGQFRPRGNSSFQGRGGIASYRPPIQQNGSTGSTYSKPAYAAGGKKCHVCGKVGCWSTRHTEAERASAKAKYLAQYGTDKTKQYAQFLIFCEGEDDEVYFGTEHDAQHDAFLASLSNGSD